MGMDPLTIGLIVAGVGTASKAYTGYKNNKTQQKELDRRNNMAEQYALPFMRQGDVGGVNQLQDFLYSMNAGNSTFGEGFNTGQDALMQMLRADPSSKVRQTLDGMMDTGNPFDTSNVFGTLKALDDRKRSEALADLRSMAPGLGQRFGSAMMREEGDLISRLLEESSARDAQIAMGSHESAQSRMLQASQLMAGRDDAQANLAQMLAQLGLAAGDQKLQKDQLGLQGLAQLIGAQQGSRTQSLQALSLLLGQPLPQGGYDVGGDMMDMASLMAMMSFMKNQPKTT